jgi:cytochrome c-type biogenesis protein
MLAAGFHSQVLAAAGGGAGDLVQHSPLGFVVAFGAGIISFVSPCVLPLVPSYLSMMSGVGVSTVAGGVGAGGMGAGVAAPAAVAADRRRLLWSTLLFVAGFSLVFALLEATASALFHPLQSHKAVLGDIAGGLIVAMGVVLAFQLPWLQREHRMAVRPSRLGPWVAPVMGMTFAFGWTPCITPVLAAVLGLASSGGTLARGEEMLVAYSLGLGVPFVVTGLAFGRMSGALLFARRHSQVISLVSGLVLAALGVLIITGQVGTISSWSSSVLQHLGLGGLTSS